MPGLNHIVKIGFVLTLETAVGGFAEIEVQTIVVMRNQSVMAPMLRVLDPVDRSKLCDSGRVATQGFAPAHRAFEFEVVVFHSLY